MNTSRLDSLCEKLDQLLKSSILETLTESDQKVGLFFSAGVDSSLIAKLCEELRIPITLISLTSQFSKDEQFLARTREFLKSPLVKRFVEFSDVRRVLPKVRKVLEINSFDVTPVTLSLATCYFLAGEEAKRNGAGVVVTAHGADTLFAGFYKYKQIPKSRLQEALDLEEQKLIKQGYRVEVEILKSLGLASYSPFIEEPIRDFARKLPLRYKLGQESNKILIRELAERKRLPEFIYNRPKKSLQYSTHINKMVLKASRGLDRA